MNISSEPSSDLSEHGLRALDEFVLLWGEMASHWGINRTMAQIHALLYATARPLDTDEIMERLQISRGNANMNLRALVDWNLVRKTHQVGSRKDFFVAEGDVWTITTTIIEERQRREIRPVQRKLDAVATELREDGGGESDAALADRVDAMVDIIEVFEAFTGALLPLVRGRSTENVRRVTNFASKLRRGRDES
ncbi:GbsR/MarR family transcriptional regulator [Rubrivirga sp. IMCC43871]|uniref:GbsR/MarR family transcriptional regulator n=1 Tax=Rubrivirga sp. IMCC43871 TaxID=3391575 RepID=UPI00399008C9